MSRLKIPKRGKLQVLEGVIVHTNWDQTEFPKEFSLFTFDEREFQLDLGRLKEKDIYQFVGNRVKVTFRQNKGQHLVGYITVERIRRIEESADLSMLRQVGLSLCVADEKFLEKYVGVWTDRKKAIIVTFRKSIAPDDTVIRPDMVEIKSGIERRIRTAERIAIFRDQKRLKEFYQRQMAAFSKANHIFIMGPGEAKDGLVREIEQDPLLRHKLVGVEACDKMTYKQIAARIKEFFRI